MLKRLEKLEKAFDQLSRQRAKLESDLSSVDGEEQAVLSALGVAVLNDNGDEAELEAKLSKFDTRRRALSAAVRKATEKLSVMESELSEQRLELARKQAEETILRVQGEMLSALAELRQLNEKQSSWAVDLNEVQERCRALEISAEEGRAATLRDLWPGHLLTQFVGNFDGRLLFSSSTNEDRLRSETLSAELDRL